MSDTKMYSKYFNLLQPYLNHIITCSVDQWETRVKLEQHYNGEHVRQRVEDDGRADVHGSNRGRAAAHVRGQTHCGRRGRARAHAAGNRQTEDCPSGKGMHKCRTQMYDIVQKNKSQYFNS